MFDSQNTNMMHSDISNHFSLAFAFFVSAFYLYLALNCAVVLLLVLWKFFSSNAFVRLKVKAKTLLRK